MDRADREQRGSPGLHDITLPEGSRAHVDDLTLEFLTSAAPPPSQDSLDDRWARAAEARIVSGGMAKGRPLGTELLATFRGTDLAELAPLLAIEDRGAHGMCLGDQAIELLAPGGEHVAALGVHHGTGSRWDGWRTDTRLLRPEALCDWLDRRGVHGPLLALQREGRARPMPPAAIPDDTRGRRCRWWSG